MLLDSKLFTRSGISLVSDKILGGIPLDGKLQRRTQFDSESFSEEIYLIGRQDSRGDPTKKRQVSRGDLNIGRQGIGGQSNIIGHEQNIISQSESQRMDDKILSGISLDR